MSHILLIEPDFLLAKIYQLTLETEGHSVEVSPGAQSGITAADSKMPEMVIIELQLVEHSGIEFLYEFRSYADWQNVPVLIHTQIPPSEFKDNWGILNDELNISDYLYKPKTSLEGLLRQVRQLSLQPA